MSSRMARSITVTTPSTGAWRSGAMSMLYPVPARPRSCPSSSEILMRRLLKKETATLVDTYFVEPFRTRTGGGICPAR